MNEAVIIRTEQPADHRQVEAVIRKAFYNIYVPGCSEHYLAHVIRSHENFIPKLDLVMELNGQIIGNVMYTKAWLIDETGCEKPILTFGPVCILPEFQRKGYGRQLLEHSFDQAVALGYDTIVIFGDPANYVARGFKSCHKYQVCLEDGTFPAAMLVKELVPGVLNGRKWIYRQSPAFDIDEQEARRFDAALPPLEKKWQPSQEAFYIMSRSTVK